MTDKFVGSVHLKAVMAGVIILAAAVIFLMNRDNSINQPVTNNTGPGMMNQNPNSDMGSMMGPITINLNPQNNSKQSGKATLSVENGQTKVLIEVTPGPKGVAQPAHLHVGNCSQTPGTIKYNLSDVVDGKSETILQPTLHFIHGLGTTLINIHKSKTEYGTYVACGDLTPAFDAASHM